MTYIFGNPITDAKYSNNKLSIKENTQQQMLQIFIENKKREISEKRLHYSGVTLDVRAFIQTQIHIISTHACTLYNHF